MKALILLLSLPLVLPAQVKITETTPAETPGKLIRINTPKLSINEADTATIVLRMEFNGAIPKSKLARVNVEDIESVSLVYSRYRLSETFDQLTLNAQRMDRLFALLPALKNNKLVQWYWVEQTGCENPESCEDYFHGFVIKLKSEIDIKKAEVESGLLDYYTSVYGGGEADSRKLDELIKKKKIPLAKRCDTITTKTVNKANRMAKIISWTPDDDEKLASLLKDDVLDILSMSFRFRVDEKGDFIDIEEGTVLQKHKQVHKLLKENFKVVPSKYNRKAVPTDMIVTVERLPNGKPHVRMVHKPVLPGTDTFNLNTFMYTVTTRIECDYIDSSRGILAKYKPGPIVMNVMKRNEKWSDYLLATDVTGSMYPYMAQVLAWHKMHLETSGAAHKFVFFNDGDNMPDNIKVDGQVGGIYKLNTSDYSKLYETMIIAMMKGNGGDLPENNIEAIIEGIKTYRDCKSVVMIADNWAAPRDLHLLSKVKVPIRLILCGTEYAGVNTLYLDMVRTNKGSLHTMEQDIYDIGNIKEGQSIKIAGHTYMLKNGRFICTTISSVIMLGGSAQSR